MKERVQKSKLELSRKEEKLTHCKKQYPSKYLRIDQHNLLSDCSHWEHSLNFPQPWFPLQTFWTQSKVRENDRF